MLSPKNQVEPNLSASVYRFKDKIYPGINAAMMTAGPFEPRRELARFIRSLRERMTPAQAGISTGGRRRTPGLRREEVAQLCGVSTNWYTWIEQGRNVSVSPFALARLADTFRLGHAQRAYLFEMAGKRDPEDGRADSDRYPLAVLDCVKAIDAPAYILDREWNACAWNAKAEHLFVGWLDRPDEPNLLRFIFLRPGARSLIRDWEERARRVTAEFRADCSAHVNDPSLQSFIEGLKVESPEFARFWNEHLVLAREGGERGFNHPTGGCLTFQQVTFNLAGRSDIKMTMLIPADGTRLA
jgi:transcriptional regulator with XRE-family HTH domain